MEYERETNPDVAKSLLIGVGALTIISAVLPPHWYRKPTLGERVTDATVNPFRRAVMVTFGTLLVLLGLHTNEAE